MGVAVAFSLYEAEAALYFGLPANEAVIMASPVARMVTLPVAASTFTTAGLLDV